MELRDRLAAASSASEAVAGPDIFAGIRERVHQSLIEDIGPQLFNDEVAPATMRERVRGEIRTRLAGERELSLADRERLVEDILDDTLAHGPIEKLLQDTSVTEIMVNGPYDVWVEICGGSSTASWVPSDGGSTSRRRCATRAWRTAAA
jgi:pilus assembly protein CpaF